MTRFSCHDTRVDLTPLSDGSSETPKKIMAPNGELFQIWGLVLIFLLYSTFLAKIKALRHGKSEFLSCDSNQIAFSG
jgi:hypothetical protein